MVEVAQEQVTPEEVTRFWLEEVGPSGWYAVDAEVDAAIADRFGALWERAARGGLQGWLCGPDGTLAYLLVTDQFPRNMFRGDPRAFATDAQGRAAALRGIVKRWDIRVPEPQRQFFYLPLMHSEVLADQEKAARLVLTRLPATGADTLRHARAHREVIRRFGRFPYRNAALGRRTTPQEHAFLDAGGYGAILRELKGPQAA